MKSYVRILIPVLLLVALLSVSGCKKKQAPPVPPPPPIPAPVAPTATLSADKTEVTAGASVLLTWNTTNASTVTIDGIGSVSSSGSKSVTPSDSTSYQLTAKGAGGTANASVRVTVTRPPAPKPVSTLTEEDEFRQNVQDIFFNYDSYVLTDAAKATLTQDAAFFTSHASEKIVIGGYCDERGSNEYNLALGENRAAAARKALINAGVDEKRIRIVSYGKEKPFCDQHTEECWQKNRRAGFKLDK